MTGEKSVEMQSHKLQRIAHEIISEGMSLDEQFQVVVLIDKLPPGWKDFKNTLRHKTKEAGTKKYAISRDHEKTLFGKFDCSPPYQGGTL